MNGGVRPHSGPHPRHSLSRVDCRGSRRQPQATGWASVELRRVPVRECHSWGRCAFCGSTTAPLHRTTIYVTAAPGFVCDDPVACARQREVSARV